MAHVSVDDCLDKVPNRFDLVLLAAYRAKALSGGAPIAVSRNNDKNPVVALREVADGAISSGDVYEGLIHSVQKFVEVDEPDAEQGPLSRGGDCLDDSPYCSMDKMTEEDFLKGLMELAPPDGRADRQR